MEMVIILNLLEPLQNILIKTLVTIWDFSENLVTRFILDPNLFIPVPKVITVMETFKMKKLDAPMLIGLRFFHLFNVFAGPSFQYILDTDFNDINIKNVENDITVGLNFGIGVEINKIGIDLRYERGFSNNEATFIDNNLGGINISILDTRPEQLILSLSVKL